MKKLIFFIIVISTGFLYGQTQTKVVASDDASGDYFGYSVDVSGDNAIIGAYRDDASGFTDAGAAYIFNRSGSSWSEQTKLIASPQVSSDYLGRSVSIDGDYAVVGAYGDDEKGSSAGAAYIFKNIGGSWTQQAKLTAGDGASSDYFGYSVSISGDYAIVSAYLNDDNGSNSGSAYIFKRDGVSWTQQEKLTASDGASLDYFGKSVSISGDYAVVGAYGNDDNGSQSGSAYIFIRSGSSWTQQEKITANDAAANDAFGYTVSISGDYAVVGAYGDDNVGSSSGSAYIFNRSGSSWSQQAKLTADDAADNDNFGRDVAIDGNNAVIGVMYDDDDTESITGSAYLFSRSGSSWSQQSKITASDAMAWDYFGVSVGISGGYAIAGAYGDDNVGTYSGSAYLFDLPPDIPTGLLATAGNGQVSLTWTVSTESDINKYKIYRSTTSGFTPSTGNKIAEPTTNSYTNTGLTNGTAYYYKISAVDDAGNESGFSTEVSATPSTLVGEWKFDGNYDNSISGKPAGAVIGSPTAYTTGGISGGYLYVPTSADGLSIPDYSDVDLPTSFTVEFWFRQRANQSFAQDLVYKGTSTTYNFRVFRQLWNQYNFGPIIAGFRSNVTGYWKQASNANQLAHNIWHHVAYTKDASGHAYYLDGTLINSQSTTDAAKTNNEPIKIADSAVDTDIDELRISSVAQTSTEISNYYNSLDNTAPSTPTNVSATASEDRVTISWTSNTEFDILKYRVYRSTTSGFTPSVDNRISEPTTTPHIDYGVTQGTTYYYKVSAVDNAGNESGYSSQVSGTPQDVTAPTVSSVSSSKTDGTYGLNEVIPVTVTFSEAVVVTGTPQLTLETGTSDAVVNYTSGSGSATLSFNYTVVSGHSSSDLDYTSTTALSLNSGTIKDAAENPANVTLPSPGATNSLGTNKALVIDGIVPAVPQGVTATAGNAQVSLSWTANTETDLANYKVYRSTTTGFTPSSDNKIAEPTTNSYIDLYRTNGTTYYYKISAVDNTGNESDFSSQVSAVPSAPTTTAGQTQFKLIANDGSAYDEFGHSVSADGDYFIVGSRYDDDNNLNQSGSAYVYKISGSSITQQPKLTASDPGASDYFGTSVAISGDYAIVGAYFEDEKGTNAGAAYIFYRNQGGTDNWGQQAKLTAGDGASSDYFGYAVSISGDYAIVGAYFNDDNGTNSGSAYIFNRNGSSWTEQQKLTASDGASQDYFGNSVAISGDYAIVGANQEDDKGTSSGSAYVFYRNQGGTDNWGQLQKLTASDGATSDEFGYSVAMKSDYAVIGSRYDDDSGSASGSAYIFTRSGNSWTEQAKIIANDGVASDFFGYSVNISDPYVAVGAYGDDDNGNSSGSAYIFKRSGTSWTQHNKFTASDGSASDLFGHSVTLGSDRLVIGAHKCTISGATQQGAAYVYTNLPPAAPIELIATPGSQQVTLKWRQNTETDFQRYRIYGGTTEGSTTKIDSTTGGITDTSKTLTGLTNQTTYYYRVTAVATDGRESGYSNEESVIPSLFIDISAGLTGVRYSSAAWGDYDNDGDLDVLLTGDSGSVIIARVYKNTDGTFSDISAGLTGIQIGAVAWGDYDNDGDLDILLSGDTGSGYVTKIYKNTNGAFSEVSVELTGVRYSSVAWGDYDNDGDLDILLTGDSGWPNYRISKVYRNDPSTGSERTFTDISAGLTGVQEGSVAWGDYDNDDDLDIVLTGWSGSSYVTKVYNNTNGSFSEISASATLIGVRYSSVAWGDYDSDGELDILLTGYSGSYTSKLYRNDNGSFTDTGAIPTGVRYSSVAWGDYDNDGDLDILLSGASGSTTYISKVYQNTNGVFSDIDAGLTLTGVQHNSVAWGDYDNDQDLDILLTGYAGSDNYVSRIYRNDVSTSNTVPATPTSLTSDASGSTVSLSWAKSTDSQTEQDALTYNLRVGSSTDGVQIVSPMADVGNGRRRVSELGNVNHNTSWTINNLIDGTYYWSVQAIDNSLMGSPFATEASFSIDIAPATPTGLTVTGGNQQATLSWSKNSESDLKKYRIYRGTSSPASTLIDSVIGSSPPDSFYVNTGLTNGVTYYYRISAVDNAGHASGYSNEVNVVPGIKTVELLTNVTSTESSGSGYPLNTYYHDVKHQSLYLVSDLVEAGVPAGASIRGVELKPSQNPGRDMKNFRVATAMTQDNELTGFVTTTVRFGPDTLKVSDVTPNSWKHFDLSTVEWDATNNLVVEFSYDNEQYTTGGGVYLRQVGSNRARQGWSNSQSGTYPFSSPMSSENSDDKVVQLKLVYVDPEVFAPTNLVATPSSQTVSLTWNHSSSPQLSHYIISQGTSSTSMTAIDSIASSDSTYVNSGLTNGTLYYYKVRAKTTEGKYSTWTPVVSTVPNYLGPVWWVATDGASTNDGSESTPFDSLSRAIIQATAGDTVKVKPGTYSGPENGGLDPEGKNIVILSTHGADTTFLGTESEFFARHFTFDSGEDSTFQLVGFTLRNMVKTDDDGGSIYIDGSSPTIKDCIFESNRITGWGEGGAVFINNASPTFTNCEFKNNRAQYSGGAIAITGSESAPEFSGCQFTNNEAENAPGLYRDTQGGAVIIRNGSPSFFDCVFDSNLAQSGDYNSVGGAVYIGDFNNLDPVTPVEFTRCKFQNNMSRPNFNDAYGGALFTDSRVVLTNCLIADNEVRGGDDYGNGYGGGLYISVESWWNQSSGSYEYGDVRLINCTISNNIATFMGGGNSSWGGGIYLQGIDQNLIMFNSILWGNSAVEFPSIDDGGSGPVADYNNIEHGSTYSWFNETNSVIVEPGFVNPAGGDYSLLNGSFCIGAGTNSFYFEEEEINAPADDILGIVSERPNPAGSNPDLGAYENSLDASPYPAQVMGLEAYGGDQQVTLSWDANAESDSISTYRIYQDVTSGFIPSSQTLIEEIGSDTITYTVTGLDNQTLYYFLVSAVNQESYEGLASQQISIRPEFAGPVWWVATNGASSNVGSEYSSLRNIQEAIDKAANNDTVMVKAGTYLGPGNRNFDFDGTRNLVIMSQDGAENTFIDAGGFDRHFVFDDGENESFQVIGFTLQNGRRTDTDGGSMIIEDGSNPTIRDCIFSNNAGGTWSLGGAVYIWSASPGFFNCSFSNNSTRYHGGALAIEGEGSNPVFVNCHFFNNQIEIDEFNDINVYGGAVYISDGSPRFTGCRFESNMVSSNVFGEGGAVYIDEFNFIDKTPVRFLRCYFQGNNVSPNGSAYGGALRIGSPAVLKNCVINNNQAHAGVSFDYDADAYGGGLWIAVNSQWNPSILDYEIGETRVINCTIANNQAIKEIGEATSEGGGIHLEGMDQRLLMFNTIIWGNSAESWNSIYHGGGATIIADFNDIEEGDTYPWFTSSNSIVADPGFINSFDWNYALSDLSPCIGVGTGVFEGFSAPPNDIEGNPRPNPQGTNPDLGAFEHVLGERPHQVFHVDGVNGDDINNDGITAPFQSIQRAINEAAERDTVKVAAGVYTGTGNRQLFFDGKNIILRSADGPAATIIDCQGETNALALNSVESGLIQGFTVENGSASDGGAINLWYSSVTFRNMIFRNNVATNNGGAVHATNSQFGFINCVFVGNHAVRAGVAYVVGDTTYFTHCTVTGNTADDETGFIANNGLININNSIVWRNSFSGTEVKGIYGGSVSVNYTNILGGSGGEGNYNGRPGFIDVDNGDFHLTVWSPMIGLADSLGPGMEFASHDIEGNLRSFSSSTAPDLGAYEHDQMVSDITNYVLQTWYADPTGSDVTGDGSAELPFGTIQFAVNFAIHIDTVFVNPGTYEQTINSSGKGVAIKSINGPDVTTIDGKHSSTVVRIIDGGTGSAFLEGFTIKNGHSQFGGGVYLENTSSTIKNSKIIGNSASVSGGGIVSFSDDPTTTYTLDLIDSDVNFNSATDRAGGISIWDVRANITNCRIKNNQADHYTGIRVVGERAVCNISNCIIASNRATTFGAGGGFAIDAIGTISGTLIADNVANLDGSGANSGGFSVWNGANVTLHNCTFINNSAGYGAGLTVGGGGTATVRSSIFWGNILDQIALATWEDQGGTLTISYSDVQGGENSVNQSSESTLTWGTGNIDSDPLFVDPDQRRYRLTVQSPCLDTGDPDLDGDGVDYETDADDQDADLTRMDMGAFPLIRTFLSGSSSGNLNVSDNSAAIISTDYTVDDDDTLTVGSGSSIYFEPGVQFTIKGVLNANGSSEGPIGFLPKDPSTKFNGVVIYPKSLYTYITITGVDANSIPLTIYNGDATLEHFTIAGNDNDTSLKVINGGVNLNHSILEGITSGSVVMTNSYVSSTDQFTNYAGGDYSLKPDAAGIDVDNTGTYTDPDNTYADAGATYHDQSSYTTNSVSVLYPVLGDTVDVSADTGAVIGISTQVQLLNQYGRYRTNGTVTWTPVLSGSSFPSSNTSTTDIEGRVTNTFVTSPSAGDLNEFTVDSDGSTASSGVIRVQPGAPDSLWMSVHTDTVITQMDTLVIETEVYDQFGNFVEDGELVAWSMIPVVDGFSLSATEGITSNGIASVQLISDPAVVVVGNEVQVQSTCGSGQQISGLVRVAPADVYALSMPDELTTTTIDVSADSPAVEINCTLIDTFNNPLFDVQVNWEVVLGAGTGESLSETSTLTDGAGFARVILNTPQVSGREYQVRGWVSEGALEAGLSGNSFGSSIALLANRTPINSDLEKILKEELKSQTSSFQERSEVRNKSQKKIRAKKKAASDGNSEDRDRISQLKSLTVPVFVHSGNPFEVDEAAVFDLDDTTAVIRVISGVTVQVDLPGGDNDVYENQDYPVTLYASDQFGNPAANGTPVEWLIDPSSSGISIFSPDTDTETTDGEATLTFRVTSSAQWSHQFKVRATVEGIENETGTFTVEDAVAPAAVSNLTITPDDWTPNNDFTITWSNPSDISGVAGVHYRIGGQSSQYMAGDDINSLSNISLPFNAEETINIWLQDNADNEDEGQGMSVIAKWDDTEPNMFNLQYPLSGWYNHQDIEDIEFSWTATFDGTSGMQHYRFVLDGANYTIHPDSIRTQSPVSLGEGGHSWVVFAVDSAGNEREAGNPQTFDLDFTSPNISHNVVNESMINNPVTINADFDDQPSGIQIAELYFRMGGEDSWGSPVDMASQNQFQITGSIVTSSGLEYYLRAEDRAGNALNLPGEGLFYSVTITIPGDGLTSSGIPGGTTVDAYQLISFPVEPDDKSPSTVLGNFGEYDDTQWRFFAYGGGGQWEEYHNISSIQTGESYFLITKESGINISTGLAHTVTTDEPFEINLTPGDWTFIGNPFDFNIPLENVYTEDSVSVLGDQNLKTYNNSWTTGFSQLEPWQGYIFKSGSANKLYINPRKSPGKSLAKIRPEGKLDLIEGEWLVDIVAENGFARDKLNQIGVRFDADDRYDNLDAFEPPMLPGGVSLRVDNRDWSEQADLYTVDIRSIPEEGHFWDLEVVADNKDFHVYLNFDGIGDIPQGFDVFVIDKTLGIAQNLRWKTDYLYDVASSNSTHELRFVVGIREFVEENNAGVDLYPDAYSLSYNFPNPFNAQTSIIFSLKDDAFVDLVVYNLLGEEISVLAKGEYRPSGYYNFIWNSRNRYGENVASGIYFMRGRITSMGGNVLLTETRKMMLVK